MSEINYDFECSNVEVSNDLGIVFSGTNSRLKHTGTGTMTISSTSGGIVISSGAADGVSIDSLLVGEAQGVITDSTLSPTVAQSGSVFRLSNASNGITVTLPTLATTVIGAQYTFVLSSTGNGAGRNFVIQGASAGEDFIGNILHDSGAGATDVIVAGSGKHILTVDDDTTADSFVTVKCIAASGVGWFISGSLIGGSSAPAFST